ncbi:hypothetical protein DICSQDRAFT_128523 [Dichomitus squalens LYAD-421 SS1]|uniref:Uncharacterized protein n=1 Tax=Dichomitus squalens (strain LYAD-421) TaxID=732165 RepID=R7ST37_DICSQ|nr:uncharacterized protein DICSQDRAFT_128523 [Dichomitus squalens LYAD-421 SS1]EJF59103.1 hypothetical protein DICSQDRAFT_128523 [Dichomitus squalens LYAD-421 SS1]
MRGISTRPSGETIDKYGRRRVEEGNVGKERRGVVAPDARTPVVEGVYLERRKYGRLTGGICTSWAHAMVHQEYDEEFPVMYSMSRGTPSAGMPIAGGPPIAGSFLSAASVSRNAENSANSSIGIAMRAGGCMEQVSRVAGSGYREEGVSRAGNQNVSDGSTLLKGGTIIGRAIVDRV